MEIDFDYTSYERNEYLMMKLKYFLNFQISGLFIYLFAYLGSFVFSSSVLAVIFIPLLMAVVFTPFMMFVLIKNGKHAWVYAFFVIILIPSIVLLLGFKLSPLVTTLLLIEMGIAYLFYYILRFSVNDWCSEINARKHRMLQQREKEEREALSQKYFNY